MDVGFAEPGRRAHLFMLSASSAGHFFPCQQLLYLLSAPPYVSRVTVTVAEIGIRIAELADLKARGHFGSLDLRFEELLLPPPRQKVGKGPEDKNRQTISAFEPLKRKLQQQKHNADAPTCIVSDMFFFFVQDLAEELRIPWYPMVPNNLRYTYACYLRTNPLLSSTDPEVRKRNLGPGLEFARVFDYPQDILDRFDFMSVKCDRFLKSEAILVNDVEAWDRDVGTHSALRDHFLSNASAHNTGKIPRVFYIGPLVNLAGFRLGPRTAFEDSERPECLTWLGEQPSNSVLYIAFGSLHHHKQEALSELAYGLENSGVSFLWVLREYETMASSLPAGFEDRCRGRGMIHKGFAAQTRILQHPSIGGFMSHCGWNSIIESICAGLPLITWPICVDQPLNARFIVNGWKAGIGIKGSHEDYNSGVSREEVTRAIQTLMMSGDEGAEVRKNVLRLKSLAETAFKEGGSSFTALHSFAEEITSFQPNRPAIPETL
ncbi:hypothetical protein R1sor_023002 [Riccia sorocarpa]|uniref:Glycosyltransferase n=1 Tax=Riccia sorocarpa TaxID=122646 RepID=A0ABD3GMZ9_9MARC